MLRREDLVTVEELRMRYNQGERFDYVFFFTSKEYFSNWYEASFIVDGVYYWCTEQYMMAKKAELFGDSFILDKIMKSTRQDEIKKLGRQIRGFNDEIWDANKIGIVFDGNYAKFTMNPMLKNYIMKQKGKVLVEASPYDKIWGIRMDKRDVGIENPNNWRGQNCLGFTLMAVRDTILKENGLL